MFWAVLCALMCAASSAGLALAVHKLYRDAPPRSSSVYWLLSMFFTSFLTLAAARTVYYVWLAAVLPRVDGGEAAVAQVDRMGIHAVMQLQEVQSWFATVVVVVGDAAVFSIFVWLIQLTFQLSGLLSHGMDQGEGHERAKIRRMAIGSFLAIAAVFTAELTVGLRFGLSARSRHMFMLAYYVLQLATVVYMIAVVVCIKAKGRDLDAVDGERVVAPIYRRLEGILMTYAVLVTQFHAISLVIFFSDGHGATIMTWMGVSTVLNNISGLVLSIVIGCSQPCVLRACQSVFVSPTDFDALLLPSTSSQFWGSRMHVTQSELQGSNRPPSRPPMMLSPARMADMEHPVFVCTDVESSSALWGVDGGRVMQQATEIHDAIIRELVAKLGGYEIATAGDAFQLAFPTIQRALLFCLTAQLRLLRAKWPRELHGLVPATRKVRAGLRTVFRGLRVRMGVHCFVEADGPLVRSVHAVTGTITCIGASTVIANAVGDLAAGGEILVTTPIATWILENQADVLVPHVMNQSPMRRESLSESVGWYSSLQWELFQLFPKRLARRRDLVLQTAGPAGDRSEGSDVRLWCCEDASYQGHRSPGARSSRRRDPHDGRQDAATEVTAVLTCGWLECEVLNALDSS